MSRKKKEVTPEIVEEVIEEVIEEVAEKVIEEVVFEVETYKITDSNRLRLRLAGGTLEDTEFDGAEIDKIDVRATPFANCKARGTTFKNVILQGCNMEGTDFKDNTFIDCDLRWGKKPGGFKENNKFINSRL